MNDISIDNPIFTNFSDIEKLVVLRNLSNINRVKKLFLLSIIVFAVEVRGLVVILLVLNSLHVFYYVYLYNNYKDIFYTKKSTKMWFYFRMLAWEASLQTYGEVFTCIGTKWKTCLYSLSVYSGKYNYL